MREFLAVCFGFFAVLLTWPVLSIPNRPLLLAGVPSLALYLFAVWTGIVLVLFWTAHRGGDEA